MKTDRIKKISDFYFFQKLISYSACICVAVCFLCSLVLRVQHVLQDDFALIRGADGSFKVMLCGDELCIRDVGVKMFGHMIQHQPWMEKQKGAFKIHSYTKNNPQMCCCFENSFTVCVFKHHEWYFYYDLLDIFFFFIFTYKVSNISKKKSILHKSVHL